MLRGINRLTTKFTGGQPPQHTATGWASHNTPVHWQVRVQTALRWVDEDERWPELAALVRVQTTRYPADGPARARTLLLQQPTGPGGAAGAGGRARPLGSHWAVENQLHWHLDVTLNQDAHRLRHQRAAENLALVRKMTLNLLRADTAKGSLKTKRKRLGWNDKYLDALLTQIAKCV